MAKGKKITVKGTEITFLSNNSNDYISLTDMARIGMQTGQIT
jgi:hypothetical protein